MDVITGLKAMRIAQGYHSPSPHDRNVTALSHGRFEMIDWVGLANEAEILIRSYPDDPDLPALLDYAHSHYL